MKDAKILLGIIGEFLLKVAGTAICVAGIFFVVTSGMHWFFMGLLSIFALSAAVSLWVDL